MRWKPVQRLLHRRDADAPASSQCLNDILAGREASAKRVFREAAAPSGSSAGSAGVSPADQSEPRPSGSRLRGRAPGNESAQSGFAGWDSRGGGCETGISRWRGIAPAREELYTLGNRWLSPVSPVSPVFSVSFSRDQSTSPSSQEVPVPRYVLKRHRF